MTTSMTVMVRRAVVLLAPMLLTMAACTNLDENPESFITPGNFYSNEAEVVSGLAGVYAQLRHVVDDYWNITEISTDELVVPTRGQDWYDNGQWLEVHGQTWAASSPSTLSLINGAWGMAYTGITRANALIEALDKLTTPVPNQAMIVAEARTLRAFYYYVLMDGFGGVPLATSTELKARERVSRDSLFQFIDAELTAARPDLPDHPATYGRIGKAVVDAIQANMYLNAAVYTKDTGVSATSYNSCTTVQIGGKTACQAAVDAADRIINSGLYQLADSFPKNFRANDDQSPENIFVADFKSQDGLGLNFVMRALHYNQFTPSPWNGFATLAATYNAFDAADERRQDVFLAGPQKNVLTGQPATDRQGNPLVFTTTINDITSATEGEGVRFYKWPADPAHVNENNGNDYAFFRLGEIYLIKAEALNEITPGSAQALTLLNALRARVFNPAKPVGAVDRNAILSERLFELTFEGKRRQDLIRFGQYTAAWQFKPVTDGKVLLLPIPQTQLDANPLLTQNPGY